MAVPLPEQASVAVFLELRDGSLLSTSAVRHMWLRDETVHFLIYGREQPIKEPWPIGYGSAAFASYKALIATGSAVANPSVNPTVFDLTKNAPGAYQPADTTLPGFWHGSTDGVNYDTFYSWNPSALEWVGVITA